MKRLTVLPLFALLAACPADKQDRVAVVPPDSTPQVAIVDSAAGDLSTIGGGIPAASSTPVREVDPNADPALRRARTPTRTASSGGAAVPEAPEPLLQAVQREQAFSRFCFTEFGQKTDPSLRGNVAMVVTVGSAGITDARVGDSNWSGGAGAAVDRCLTERAPRAWKLAPGAVTAGRYVVHLSFTGS